MKDVFELWDCWCGSEATACDAEEKTFKSSGIQSGQN